MKTFIKTIAIIILCLLQTTAFAQSPSGAVIIPPASGEHLELGTGIAIIKIPGEMTEGRFSQIELVERPGYQTPLHVHEHTDELFYVAEGTLTILVDGKRNLAEAGSHVFIPKGTPHAQGNFSDTIVRTVITFFPAGFEAFFAERAEIVSNHEPGSDAYRVQMRQLGENYDIRNIDFSPFRDQDE